MYRCPLKGSLRSFLRQDAVVTLMTLSTKQDDIAHLFLAVPFIGGMMELKRATDGA